MAKVTENKRNLSSWGIIVQEPQSDHVLRRVYLLHCQTLSSSAAWVKTQEQRKLPPKTGFACTYGQVNII